MGETMPTKRSAAEMAAEVLALRAQLEERDREIASLYSDLEELRLGNEHGNAILEEQAREIERLKAERDLATHKCITCGVAAENPEIASKGVYVEKWDSPQAQAVRKVVAQLSASQAREREAVTALAEARERADKAEHWIAIMREGILEARREGCACDFHLYGEDQELDTPEALDAYCTLEARNTKLECEALDLESALAAARKALEKIAEAPGDNIGVWCRSTAIKALEFPEGHKPGCRYGEPPTTFMDGGYPCTCGYRAALAPEQKGE